MAVFESHPATSARGPLWASIWYAVTLGAWVASWGMERLGESNMAALTALAILAELVSVAVRWKYLGGAPYSIHLHVANGEKSTAEKHPAELAWLCAWGGLANMLGLLAMLSPNLASTLPALIATAAVETFLWSRSPFAREAVGQQVSERTGSNAAPSVEVPSPLDLDALEGATVEPDSQPWLRSTQAAQTDEGQPYLSGWVRFQFAADQKAVMLTVGFSPSFPDVPAVELDQEVDTEEAHCETQLEHVTPAGMRVAIKRTTAGAPLVGKLLWHASQSEDAPSPLRSRLP